MRDRAARHVDPPNFRAIEIEDRAIIDRRVEGEVYSARIADEVERFAEVIRGRTKRHFGPIQIRIAQKLHFAQTDKLEVAPGKIRELIQAQIAGLHATQIDQLREVGLCSGRFIE